MKTMKKVLSIALVGAMMLSVAACGKGNYKIVDKKTFKNALEDVADFDSDEIHDYEDYYDGAEHDLDCWDGNIRYEYIQFEDNEAAMDFFDDYYYEDFQDMVDDHDFSGTRFSSHTNTSAYIIINGESDSDDFFDDDIYGGFFCKEDTVVLVYAISDRQRDMDAVDEFLSAIGYPHP